MKKSKKIFKAKPGARFKKSRIQAYGEEMNQSEIQGQDAQISNYSG